VITSGIETSEYEFKFVPEKDKKGKGTGQACITKISAYSVMDRCKSGSIKEKQTPKLLKHEQGHFDISEIWARRLNKKLQGLCGRGKTVKEAEDDLKKEVDKLFDEHFKDLDKMQKDYDKETEGSRNDAKQTEWNKKISDLLKAG
jgi:Bacterial protein of unknown function (DUF922)